MGENEYGESGHLSIFTLLKHLMMLLRCIFSGLHFYTLSKALIACRNMQLRFFKVKTLLNNASGALRVGGITMPLKYHDWKIYNNTYRNFLLCDSNYTVWSLDRHWGYTSLVDGFEGIFYKGNKIISHERQLAKIILMIMKIVLRRSTVLT